MHCIAHAADEQKQRVKLSIETQIFIGGDKWHLQIQIFLDVLENKKQFDQFGHISVNQASLVLLKSTQMNLMTRPIDFCEAVE